MRTAPSSGHVSILLGRRAFSSRRKKGRSRGVPWVCSALAGGVLAALAQEGVPAKLPTLRPPIRGWAPLAPMDRDGDRCITLEEFTGPADQFTRLDLNGDGLITPAEALARNGRSFEGTGGPPRQLARPAAPPSGPAGLIRRLDAGGDGLISRSEWDDFFSRADANGDDLLEPAELQAALRGRQPPDPAPREGDPAPQVRARKAGTDEWIDLSSPGRLTVLIFGSHT